MKAIHLFQKTTNPNDILYIVYFQACAQIGSFEGVNLIKMKLNNIPQSFYKNERLSTSLIDALIECKDIETAELIYNSTCNPSIQMTGALMNGKHTHLNDSLVFSMIIFRIHQ